MNTREGIGWSVTILILDGLLGLAFILSIADFTNHAPDESGGRLVAAILLALLSLHLLLIAWLVALVATIARRQGAWSIMMLLVPAAVFVAWYSFAHYSDVFRPSGGFFTPQGNVIALVLFFATPVVMLVYAVHGVVQDFAEEDRWSAVRQGASNDSAPPRTGLRILVIVGLIALGIAAASTIAIIKMQSPPMRPTSYNSVTGQWLFKPALISRIPPSNGYRVNGVE